MRERSVVVGSRTTILGRSTCCRTSKDQLPTIYKSDSPIGQDSISGEMRAIHLTKNILRNKMNLCSRKAIRGRHWSSSSFYVIINDDRAYNPVNTYTTAHLPRTIYVINIIYMLYIIMYYKNN